MGYGHTRSTPLIAGHALACSGWISLCYGQPIASRGALPERARPAPQAIHTLPRPHRRPACPTAVIRCSEIRIITQEHSNNEAQLPTPKSISESLTQYGVTICILLILFITVFCVLNTCLPHRLDASANPADSNAIVAKIPTVIKVLQRIFFKYLLVYVLNNSKFVQE